MWYRKFAQTDIPTDPAQVQKVYNNFISHSGSGMPQFVKGNDNVTRLLIHGTQRGADGKIYFFIGESYTDSSGMAHQNYLPQDKMGEWMISKGYPQNTHVIGCYSSLAAGDITPETMKATGVIEIGAPEGGVGDSLTLYD